MRQQRALVFGLLLSWLVGCAVAEPARPTSWLSRRRPFQGPTGPDVVQMQVALLECPVGDRYLNDDLWALADEQQFLSCKSLLEENGWRIGQIGGVTPAKL